MVLNWTGGLTCAGRGAAEGTNNTQSSRDRHYIINLISKVQGNSEHCDHTPLCYVHRPVHYIYTPVTASIALYFRGTKISRIDLEQNCLLPVYCRGVVV